MDLDTLARVRRWMLVLLIAGLIGTGTELLLLNHYEDGWQIAPLALIAASIGAATWHVMRRGAGPIIALQVLMACCIAAGAVGLVLHFRGNLEFQLEIDATQSSWELFRKVLRAKTPPALAPAVMAQLGFLGLAYTYRHPDSTGELK